MANGGHPGQHCVLPLAVCRWPLPSPAPTPNRTQSLSPEGEGAAGSAAVVFAVGSAGLCASGMECTLSHVPRVTRLFIESG